LMALSQVNVRLCMTGTMDMTVGKFVAYYRVSTERQGRSGLGLEAQREAVMRYLSSGGWPPLAEFTEVETGKGANALDRRPQLQAALAYARKHKATLVIAKLDRLARNVHFISGLIEQRVPIVAADMPDADITMLQIYAVMAEREARVIGERTKAALAAAKAQGRVLGANGRILADKHKAEAVDRLGPIADRLRALKAEGLTLRRIAEALNVDGIPSPGGASWHPGNVQRALARVAV
jgi:DNA invertase Pin-like site-specific DNA recombinase